VLPRLKHIPVQNNVLFVTWSVDFYLKYIKEWFNFADRKYR